MGIETIVGAIITAVVSVGISYASKAIFGNNQKPSQPSFGNIGDSSPRYGFGALQNTITSEVPVATIYGEIKYAGNYLLQDPPEGGEQVIRALGVCVGEIERIYDVRFNDLFVDSKGQYIGIDLGDGNDQAIQEVKVYQGASGFDGYIVQASYDKVSWDDIATGNLTASVGYQTISFSNAVAYRYWRLLSSTQGHSASEIVVNLIELRTTGGGADQASGKGAFATHEQTGRLATSVTDGNIATSWRAFREIHANNEYSEHLGTFTQPVDSLLTGIIDYSWRGTAYIALQIKADDKMKGDPTVTSIVRGKKMKVWNGSIFTGSEWSDNPAECLRDFLTDVYNGIGISEDQIDDDSFGSVAEFCDEIIQTRTGNNEKRYTLNFVIDSRKPALDYINEMLQAFGGFLVNSQGKYVLKVRRVESSVMAFDDGVNGANDNIVMGSFGYAKQTKDDRANRIRFQYIDPNQNWTKVYALAEDQIDQDERAESEGGDGVFTKEIASLGVTRFTQASRLAMLMLKEMKYAPITCSFRTTIKAIPLDAGDIITVSHSLPNWTAKPFRVLELKHSEDDEIEVRCMEYNSSLYNDENGSGVQAFNYGTVDNPLGAPPAPLAVNVTESGSINASGDWTGWIDIAITKPVNTSFISHYQIEYQIVGDSDWKVGGTTTGDVFRLVSVTAPISYNIRVKSISVYDRASDPVEADENPLTTVGKLAPPADVENFAVNFAIDHLHFTWKRNTDSDIFAYEIREGATWNTAVVIATDITENLYDLFSISTGQKTYWIKAIDTSGIYSTNAVNDAITITSIPQQNIILEMEDLFKGTVSGDAEFIKSKDYDASYWRDAVAIKTTDTWDDMSSYPLTYEGTFETGDGVYTSEVIDLGQSFTSIVSLAVSVANVSGGNLTIQIAYSEADPDPSTFENFSTGEYVGRYFKFKFTFSTIATEALRVFKIAYSFDVPDKEQSAVSVPIDVAGTLIPLTDFYALKTLVVNAVGSPYKEEIVSQSASGFTVKLKDLEDGTYKAGNINYLAKGY